MTNEIPEFLRLVPMKTTMDQVVTKAVLTKQRVRTPLGRIGFVTGEYYGRLDITYEDDEFGNVSLKPQLCEFLEGP